MKYRVIETKAGFAVQNTFTYSIVYVYSSKEEANRIARNLNKV